MTKSHDITVNGITVRLYRLSAKQQHDIVNQYFFPITTQAGELVNVIIRNPQNQIAIASAIAEAVNKFMPANKRDELIFKHLMPSVKVVAVGMEVDYCSIKGEITCEELNNIKSLYKITYEALKYNFEDFFTDWLNENKLS